MNNRLEHAVNYSAKRMLQRGKILKASSTFIYIFECQGYYKIGLTDDVKKRVNGLQVGCPFDIRIVKSWRSNDARVEERRIHQLLEAYHVRGEWFKLPDDLLAKLME